MPRDTSVCVFLKPPIAGAVKTRLIPQVGSHGTAALAKAFFRETSEMLLRLSSGQSQSPRAPARLILAFCPIGIRSPGFKGKETLALGLRGFSARRSRLPPLAIVVGTDSLGMPTRLFHQAHDALQAADAVLGPCDDRGVLSARTPKVHPRRTGRYFLE